MENFVKEQRIKDLEYKLQSSPQVVENSKTGLPKIEEDEVDLEEEHKDTLPTTPP